MTEQLSIHLEELEQNELERSAGFILICCAMHMRVPDIDKRLLSMFDSVSSYL